MIDINACLIRVETTRDGLRKQWEQHCRVLQWLFGIGVTWLTILLTLYTFV